MGESHDEALPPPLPKKEKNEANYSETDPSNQRNTESFQAIFQLLLEPERHSFFSTILPKEK
jgi:hypothetical protein